MESLWVESEEGMEEEGENVQNSGANNEGWLWVGED